MQKIISWGPTALHIVNAFLFSKFFQDFEPRIGFLYLGDKYFIEDLSFYLGLKTGMVISSASLVRKYYIRPRIMCLIRGSVRALPIPALAL